MNTKEKELKEIGENTDTLNQLNELISKWAEKKGWYIIINRINKKGWLIYGLENGGKQLQQYCGLGVIKRYFDNPETNLNEFINTKFI